MYFTRDVFSRANPLLSTAVANTIPGQPARVLFAVDDGVSRAHPGVVDAIEEYCQVHGGAVTLGGPVLIVPGGEQAKNDPKAVQRILESIHGAALCRHSYVAAVGGGAVLDVVGYAAATVHRGIRLIRLPTTVLSQDDSAVGVKNGINAYGQKNYLGTFAPPFAVINDFNFLTTLSDRDWRGGRRSGESRALTAGLLDCRTRAKALAARDLRQELVIAARRTPPRAHRYRRDPFEMGVAAARFRPLSAHSRAPSSQAAARQRSDRRRARPTYSHLADCCPCRVAPIIRTAGPERRSSPRAGRHRDGRITPRACFSILRVPRDLVGRLTVMLLRGLAGRRRTRIERDLPFDITPETAARTRPSPIFPWTPDRGDRRELVDESSRDRTSCSNRAVRPLERADPRPGDFG